MLKIFAICFLSLAVSMPYTDASIMTTDNSSKDNIVTITTGTEEIEMTKLLGMIGRHRVLSIDEDTVPEYVGRIPVQYYTSTFQYAAFKNVHFTETYTTIQTTSISTTTEFSQTATSKISSFVSVGGVSVGAEASVSQTYTIQNTKTYTTSTTTTFTMDYYLNDEMFDDDDQIALGVVADVYRYPATTWLWDDYWWGDYEVDGSRETFYIYVTINPVVTVIFSDGTFIGQT